MTDYIFYYGGVFNPALPADNAYQEYAESTGLFTQWGPQGPNSAVEVGPVAMTTEQLAMVAAWDAANTAAATLAANQAAIQANCAAHLATLQTWLTNNPNGAVLTAAQTKVLANMLVGIYLILTEEFSSTTGT